MKEKRPVIFAIQNYISYLPFIIKQAERSGNEVVLLGNIACKGYCSNFVDIEQLESSESLKFKEIYVHASKNPYWFEFSAIKRYFMIWAYMRKNNISECVVCDTDVLLYENMSNYDYGDYDAVLRLTDHRDHEKEPLLWDAGGEAAFWTLDALEKFIYFIIDFYENRKGLLQERWEYVCNNNIAGGMHDMALLGLWVIENSNNMKIGNSACLGGGGLLDTAITISDGRVAYECLMDSLLGIKKVKFVDGKPYFWSLNEKRWIQSFSIHLQGHAKRYILSMSGRMNGRIIHMLVGVFYNYFWLNFDRTKIVKKIMKESKVCVYGVGPETEEVWPVLKKYNVIYIDKKASDENLLFHGRKVFTFEMIANEVKDYKFIIFSKNYGLQMREKLLGEGISSENVYIVWKHKV